jgi:hypothetical protein
MCQLNASNFKPFSKMHAACCCGFQILAHQLHFGDNLSPWSKALTKKVNFSHPGKVYVILNYPAPITEMK